MIMIFAKGHVNQKGKSPSKLATILRATKKQKRKKNYATNTLIREV